MIYNVARPFTHLGYILGAQNEQVFRATHTQNIKGRFAFGADADIISSPGLYENQKANTEKFHLYTRIRSKNRRYELTAGYLANNIKNELNGGTVIQTDSVFTFFRKNTVPVNLNAANARYNKKYYYLQQVYHLGGQFTYRLNDTTSVNLLIPKSGLFHRFIHEREAYQFQDLNPDTAFYDALILSYDSTSDQTFTRRFLNYFGWKSLGIRTIDSAGTQYSDLNWELMVGHQYTLANQQGREFAENDLLIQASIESNAKRMKKLEFSGHGKYIVAGNNAGNASFSGHISIPAGKHDEFVAKANYTVSSPNFIQNHYLSNHYFWENDFEFTKSSILSIFWQNKKIRTSAGIDINRIGNYIFWDTTGNPAQLQESLDLISGWIKSEVNVGKFWLNVHLNAQLHNQKQVLQVPEFVMKGRLYFQDYLFGKAMYAQIGFETTYYSPYSSPTFNPVTGQFQRHMGEGLSSYPIIDAFINFKVKDAKVFFKITHLNQDILFPAGYFVLPGYPSSDRAFRLGISWDFYN